jgi:hypothetical protein
VALSTRAIRRFEFDGFSFARRVCSFRLDFCFTKMSHLLRSICRKWSTITNPTVPTREFHRCSSQNRVKSRIPGLRGWEFCPFSPFFANFSTFTKIPQVPSFQAHSPVKTVFRQNPKNAPKSQNTPSTNPYQNETQFPLSSLKNATSGHARPPKSVLCPPVISGTNSRQNTLEFP